MQTDNPSAPDYDWQADREWFNQRLANARIHNSELEQKLAAARTLLREVRLIIRQPLGLRIRNDWGNKVDQFLVGSTDSGDEKQ
jgi:hypothetical protein